MSFLRLKQVLLLVNVSKGTIRNWEIAGIFPKRVKIGKVAGWRSEDIDAWLNEPPGCWTIRKTEDYPTHVKGAELVKNNCSEPVYKKPVAKQKAKANPINKIVWTAYSESYVARYGAEPVRNAKTNSCISGLVKRLGQDAVEVVKFYLKHNDGYYLKKTHSIDLCLKDAETLHTQWRRGQPIKSHQVRDFEKADKAMDVLKDIRDPKFWEK